MSDEMRMEAYYYQFTPTGVFAIDKILSAVACAGKAFHHTSEWSENNDYKPYSYHEGDTCSDWIQNAANGAAAEVSRLRATLREVAEWARGRQKLDDADAEQGGEEFCDIASKCEQAIE